MAPEGKQRGNVPDKSQGWESRLFRSEKDTELCGSLRRSKDFLSSGNCPTKEVAEAKKSQYYVSPPGLSLAGDTCSWSRAQKPEWLQGGRDSMVLSTGWPSMN